MPSGSFFPVVLKIIAKLQALETASILSLQLTMCLLRSFYEFCIYAVKFLFAHAERLTEKSGAERKSYFIDVREYLSAKVINRITCHLKTQTSLSYEIKFCETLNVA